MIALAVGLRCTPSPAAIVGYSGALPTAEALLKDPGTGPRSCSCMATWTR